MIFVIATVASFFFLAVILSLDLSSTNQERFALVEAR